MLELAVFTDAHSCVGALNIARARQPLHLSSKCVGLRVHGCADVYVCGMRVYVHVCMCVRLWKWRERGVEELSEPGKRRTGEK